MKKYCIKAGQSIIMLQHKADFTIGKMYKALSSCEGDVSDHRCGECLVTVETDNRTPVKLYCKRFKIKSLERNLPQWF